MIEPDEPGERQELMKQVVWRDEDGWAGFSSGIMRVVTAGGVVRLGGAMRVELPKGPHQALEIV